MWQALSPSAHSQEGSAYRKTAELQKPLQSLQAELTAMKKASNMLGGQSTVLEVSEKCFDHSLCSIPTGELQSVELAQASPPGLVGRSQRLRLAQRAPDLESVSAGRAITSDE